METVASHAHWEFWIDTGGTFTDCLAKDAEGRNRKLKVLSSSALRGRVTTRSAGRRVSVSGLTTTALPNDFFSGYELRVPAAAYRGRITGSSSSGGTHELTLEADLELDAGTLVETMSPEEAPILAIRLLTGRRLEQELPPLTLRLATTRGTNALLEGKGGRVAFFVTEGFADLLVIGNQQRPDLFALDVTRPVPLYATVVEIPERLDAGGKVLRSPDLSALRLRAEALRKDGYSVAAVCLMHAYRNPVHEAAVEACLGEVGFEFVSVSSSIAPFIKLLDRAETTVVDAYLAPVMTRYLDRVDAVLGTGRLFVMTSSGGLVSRRAFRPKDSLLSGPAGGVVGAVASGVRAGCNRIIGFDMGGTSTDVARFGGAYDYSFSQRVGPARILAPALRIESVAAGGGSICRFDGHALVVGPDSAGAYPGPACYGAGGPLTLTDVNLLLGRLDAARFGIPVFPERAELRLTEVLRAVSESTGRESGRTEILKGFLEIADERMAEAIRKISVREGYDTRDYALVAFGGAGGLHACGVASRLDIGTILFPDNAGLLSAEGLMEAVIERFVEWQVLRLWQDEAPLFSDRVKVMENEVRRLLGEEGIAPGDIVLRAPRLELRYEGQESTVPVDFRDMPSVRVDFEAAYRAKFGYVPTDRRIELVTVRVSGTSRAPEGSAETFEDSDPVHGGPEILQRSELAAGQCLAGPRVIQDPFSTVFVADGWTVEVGSACTLRIRVASEGPQKTGRSETSVVALELYTNRFRGLVESMGSLLQRTALSINVKERMDFSCGLLDADGELVANAPHIPVHLGALGECVRTVTAHLRLGPGDVAVTNHPGFGGSHLPDITLIAPVHDESGQLLGYVANRAHHAEVGGARPGSMPPDAVSLEEEGVVISPVLLKRGGEVDWDPLMERLAGGRWPSRRPAENRADLEAQLAAALQGADALCAMARAYGTDEVTAYMRALKARTAGLVMSKLGEMGSFYGMAEERLDDGTPIRVSMRVENGRMEVDFTGTGLSHPGNLNATPAIVRSAVLYVLRLLVSEDVPLNEGLMSPVTIRLPRCFLNPDFPRDAGQCPAVVGGNVETSQRIVDTLFKALRLAACSQGTMNNLIFGNENCSYYETIGGGTGGTANAAGASGVHSHMTNTAITDPEILEFRFPVRLERFAIRAGSGGAGKNSGGNGLVRRIRFLESVEVSLLTQHRAEGPFGMNGGSAGQPGRQGACRIGGQVEELGSIVSVDLGAGDVLEIETPGGGGWGKPQ